MSKRDVIFVLLVLAVGVQLCAAGEVQWLQYRSAREAYRLMGMLMDSIIVTTERPEAVEMPKFEAQEQFFGRWHSPMVRDGYRLMALDRTHKQGPYDRLYIDSNGDGKLSDETMVQAHQIDQYFAFFGPVPIIFEGEDEPITYHLNFRFYVRCPDHPNRPTQLHVSSGGWYEGNITVAGEKKYCVLIDYNANGTFDDKSASAYRCDRVRIGKKDEGDTRFVGNYIEIDGEFYRPEIARDGAYIKLEVAEDIRFGKVKLQEGITEFSTGGENGLFTLQPEKGVGELPVGKYRVDYWVIERKDDGGIRGN